ncbi:MAG: hypothetical protein MMC33_006690 [Icmadophila ericetorum]|nr:hypothetical protein [Icmadophila ericetorum]
MNQNLLIGWWLAIAIIFLAAVRAVSLPGCQIVAPQQKTLNEVRTARFGVPNLPFGLVYAFQKDIAFVSLDSTLGVLNTSTFAPSLIHQIPLPAAYVNLGGALGLALTKNGQYILVSIGPGLLVVNVARAVAGSPDAVVGALNGTTGNQMPGNGAIEVTVSLDDKYAFVSQEYGSIPDVTPGNIDVFKLDKPTSNGSVSGIARGYLSLGYAVVGTALSPDGSILYAASEQISISSPQGSLSVIDVKTLQVNPAEALLSNVPSGCGPVRIIVSSDGKIVWVTARESNHLLAFDAAKLMLDPGEALLASVQVGTSPVGLTFVRSESRILTADSNRFSYPNATTGLSVVDVHAALSGKPAVLGRIPTGLFPREFAVSPDGSVILVADYDSEEIQAVDVATLP